MLPGSKHTYITLELDLESPSNAADASRPPSRSEGLWLDLFISRLKKGSWQSKGSLVRVPFDAFATLFQQKSNLCSPTGLDFIFRRAP